MKYNFDEIIDRTGTSATKMESLPYSVLSSDTIC